MEDRVGAHMDDALAFVPSGANLLEAVRGELNGDGIEYQLLVIDQPTPEGLVPGQHGPNRVLLLLRGDGRGRWQLAARNDKLVPCSTRGGLAGDPFAYAMVEKGTFSVITNGGSRERWSSTYRFRYAPADKACWVDGVETAAQALSGSAPQNSSHVGQRIRRFSRMRIMAGLGSSCCRRQENAPGIAPPARDAGHRHCPAVANVPIRTAACRTDGPAGPVRGGCRFR